jgi:hypothetical protein
MLDYVMVLPRSCPRYAVDDFVASAEGTTLLTGVEKSLHGGSPEDAMQMVYKAVIDKYRRLTNGAGSCYPVSNRLFHDILILSREPVSVYN